MKIVINESNTARIAQAIEQAQARARARAIAAIDVFRAVGKIERKLQDVPKTAREGVRVIVDQYGGERYPNSYRGRPESTQFTMEYTAGTWKLIDVSRADVVQTKGGYMTISLPEATRAAIIAAYERW